MKTIKIGSRDSRLAVCQAQEVLNRLGGGTLTTMKTLGDKILDRTLDKVGGKGLFVKELDLALLDGRIDLAVHSLKDVPMELPEGLTLLAFPPRADARDALVLPESGVWDQTRPIGCSAARRQAQLGALFPEIEVRPVRGNVQTRLAKLEAGQYGALVLAAAGLQRLGLSHRVSRVFTPEEMLPAAGQGILAVEGRAGEWAEETRLLDDASARACAMAERAFVRTLDGGCFSPIAAYAETEEGLLHLRGLYVTGEGRAVRGALTGACDSAETLGRTLALQLKWEAEGRI
ncbi:hydroxymethylbilane synthase [Butyricicoccus faecihominis]|uniref:hydroxymethylbilane synthase n=1 Tax=Butyricicoccus faecihominis TaxID=1712515 RepID=UPI00247B0D8F|nr:hydroxymethylbilane synthase [Butyricicoccus faecihominis]MCQ5129634.1 hydroxymethylbilane synthase [Butyricicoccus faecihominis]